MVIDDDELYVRSISYFLKSKGYKVIYALGGEDAFKVLETVTPDIILLDIMMPRMDGWKVLSQIRSDKKLASTPVIMLTALPLTVDIVAKKSELGFTNYLTKPFELDVLHSEMTEALKS